MRLLVQRVAEARVAVAGEIAGEIGAGLLLLVGVTHGDTIDDARLLATKAANLRIFDDEAGNLNRSLLDVAAGAPEDAGALVVSQFTLYADTRRGRRPSFVAAARPEHARPLVEACCAALRELGLRVAEGRFGAEMQVALVNDGPVTIWLDTSDLRA